MGCISELFAAEQKAENEKTNADTKPTPNKADNDIDAHTVAESEKNDESMEKEEDEVQELKDSYHRLASRLVAQKCDVVVDQKEESMLAQALKGTCAVRGEPGEGKYRAIIYDSKTSGEAATTPWRRLPPLKAAQVVKCIGSALKVLAGEKYAADPTELEIGQHDMYLFFDAMKHGQEKVWAEAFAHNEKKLPKKVKQYYIAYDEETLRQKGKGERSMHDDTEVDCMEYLQCVTAGQTSCGLLQFEIHQFLRHLLQAPHRCQI